MLTILKDACQPIDEHYLSSRHEKKHNLRRAPKAANPPAAEQSSTALPFESVDGTTARLVRALDDLTLAKILRVFWNGELNVCDRR